MRLLDRLGASLFGKAKPIASADALADFIDSRAAFLCQKGIVEFCRVRAGVYWQKLFSEPEFQTALAHSRWRAYPPCYAMLAEMVEGVLREAAGARRSGLPAALEKLARDSFAKYPVPNGSPENFWEDAAGLVRERLSAARAAPPRAVREIPDPTARMVFDALPIHPELVTDDYDYIFNFLRMNVLRAHEDLIERADRAAIADELLRPVRA